MGTVYQVIPPTKCQNFVTYRQIISTLASDHEWTSPNQVLVESGSRRAARVFPTSPLLKNSVRFRGERKTLSSITASLISPHSQSTMVLYFYCGPLQHSDAKANSVAVTSASGPQADYRCRVDSGSQLPARGGICARSSRAGKPRTSMHGPLHPSSAWPKSLCGDLHACRSI